jgi:hypothetical protein
MHFYSFVESGGAKKFEASPILRLMNSVLSVRLKLIPSKVSTRNNVSFVQCMHCKEIVCSFYQTLPGEKIYCYESSEVILRLEYELQRVCGIFNCSHVLIRYQPLYLKKQC